MSSQNTMAKESYPYKIIHSGYAPSSSHKIFISCTTPVSAKHLFSYSILSNLSTFMQYMSVSHGHSTMWNREVVVEKTKRREIVSHQLGVSTGYGDTHQ